MLACNGVENTTFLIRLIDFPMDRLTINIINLSKSLENREKIIALCPPSGRREEGNEISHGSTRDRFITG